MTIIFCLAFTSSSSPDTLLKQIFCHSEDFTHFFDRLKMSDSLVTDTIRSFLGQNFCWMIKCLTTRSLNSRLTLLKLEKWSLTSFFYSDLTLDVECNWPWTSWIDGRIKKELAYHCENIYKGLNSIDRISLPFYLNEKSKLSDSSSLNGYAYHPNSEVTMWKELACPAAVDPWCFCFVAHFGNVKVCGVYSCARTESFTYLWIQHFCLVCRKIEHYQKMKYWVKLLWNILSYFHLIDHRCFLCYF